MAVEVLASTTANDGRVFEELGRLKAPIVAIIGDYEVTDAASLASHGVQVHLMPEVGHFLMIESPAEFNRLLDEVIARI